MSLFMRDVGGDDAAEIVGYASPSNTKTSPSRLDAAKGDRADE